MLRATTASTFSTSQLPKVLREWCVLYILTWKCASRHNGVQFFISHLATWLRTRRFSEPTFRPRSHKSLEKYSVLRLCFRAPAFFFLSLFLFPNLLSSALLFSDSFHLCLSIRPYCRKFDFQTSLDECVFVYMFVCVCAGSLPPSFLSLSLRFCEKQRQGASWSVPRSWPGVVSLSGGCCMLLSRHVSIHVLCVVQIWQGKQHLVCSAAWFC